MFAALAEFDILLGNVHSLKDKRSVVRPLVADIARKYAPQACVAETGDTNLHRRAEIGVAVVGTDSRHCGEILDQIERTVATRPDIELLSAHRRLIGPGD